jgi:hypothetical protein
MYVCMYVCTCVHLWLYVCVCVNMRMCIAVSSFPPSTVSSMCTKHFSKKKKKEQIHGFMKVFLEDICDYLYTTLGVS